MFTGHLVNQKSVTHKIFHSNCNKFIISAPHIYYNMNGHWTRSGLTPVKFYRSIFREGIYCRLPSCLSYNEIILTAWVLCETHVHSAQLVLRMCEWAKMTNRRHHKANWRIIDVIVSFKLEMKKSDIIHSKLLIILYSYGQP